VNLKRVIILELEGNKNLKALAKTRDRNGDLWQNVMLYYLEMDESKLVGIYNAGYLPQHCNLLITRSSLNYHEKDKHAKRQVYIDDISIDVQDDEEYVGEVDELENTLNHLINTLPLYDRELLNLVYRGVETGNGDYKKFKNLVEVSKETGISYYTLRNALIEIKKTLNDKITHITNKGQCA
jgi:hypothetical protein